MKVQLANNAELIIQANSESDYAKALQVAERIVDNSQGQVEIASADEYEHWVHLCAVWSHYQRGELLDEYRVAKKEIA